MSAILWMETKRRWSFVAAAGVILLAWLVLAVWGLSPFAEWLDHSRIEEIAAPPIVRLVVFTLGWALMVVAMMLPGTWVLLARCEESALLNSRRIVPVTLAYLAVWTVFGVFSYLSDNLLHEIVEQVPALAGVIAPGVLVIAGIYQMTPMKRVCLSRCRPEGTAFTTLGQASHPNVWHVGMQHGMYCLGSGWALMLLMFAIGGVNLIWMLVLGVIMLAERMMHHGDQIAQLLGLTLIVCSFLVMLH